MKFRWILRNEAADTTCRNLALQVRRLKLPKEYRWCGKAYLFDPTLKLHVSIPHVEVTADTREEAIHLLEVSVFQFLKTCVEIHNEAQNLKEVK